MSPTAVQEAITAADRNRVLQLPPLISVQEQFLPRSTHTLLSQLWLSQSKALNSYLARIRVVQDPKCPAHRTADQRKICNTFPTTSQAMNFFPVKIAATWNQLPENIVSAGTVNTFKNRLDKFWITNPPSTTSY
ncbi:hypothetical protein FHG87_014372 [Trinorchestia longiramus]|nr:hypothetical protein FHG87_014372 [Trinorchestia longiramus]